MKVVSVNQRQYSSFYFISASRGDLQFQICWPRYSSGQIRRSGRIGFLFWSMC